MVAVVIDFRSSRKTRCYLNRVKRLEWRREVENGIGCVQGTKRADFELWSERIAKLDRECVSGVCMAAESPVAIINQEGSQPSVPRPTGQFRVCRARASLPESAQPPTESQVILDPGRTSIHSARKYPQLPRHPSLLP